MNFEKITTKQGLCAYVREMPYVNSVAMGILARVGTVDEIRPEEAGLAHAMEHMVFQGTEKFPSSYLLTEHIESIGGRCNASTSWERTFFYVSLPAREARRGAEFLSQLIRKPLFRQEDIGTEIENVIQEIKRRDDDCQTYLLDSLFGELHAGHPLGRDILGDADVLRSLKPEHFRSFQEKFYGLENLIFVAAGNVKKEEIIELSEEYFPETVSGIISPKKEIIPCPMTTARSIVTNRDIRQAHIVLGASTCGHDNPDWLALAMFAKMISGGMSFPLFQEVRDKRGLAYEVWAGHNSHKSGGHFMLYIGTDPDKCRKAIDLSLEVIKSSKSSPELFEKAKSLVMGELAMKNEATKDIIYSAARMLSSFGKVHTAQEEEEMIRAVTQEQITAAVNKYLAPERLVEMILMPK